VVSASFNVKGPLERVRTSEWRELPVGGWYKPVQRPQEKIFTSRGLGVPQCSDREGWERTGGAPGG